MHLVATARFLFTDVRCGGDASVQLNPVLCIREGRFCLDSAEQSMSCFSNCRGGFYFGGRTQSFLALGRRGWRVNWLS